MKPVKNFLFAALLVSSLAFNTFAGDIETPGAPAPPPPPARSVSDAEKTPATGTDAQNGIISETDYFFYEALAAFLSVY